MTMKRIALWSLVIVLVVVAPLILHYARLALIMAPFGGPTHTRTQCLSVVTFDGGSEAEKDRRAQAFAQYVLTESTTKGSELIMPWVRLLTGDSYPAVELGGLVVKDGPQAGQYRLRLFYGGHCDRKDAMTARFIAAYAAAFPGDPPPRPVPTRPDLDRIGCVGGPWWLDGDETCP